MVLSLVIGSLALQVLYLPQLSHQIVVSSLFLPNTLNSTSSVTSVEFRYHAWDKMRVLFGCFDGGQYGTSNLALARA